MRKYSIFFICLLLLSMFSFNFTLANSNSIAVQDGINFNGYSLKAEFLQHPEEVSAFMIQSADFWCRWQIHGYF